MILDLRFVGFELICKHKSRSERVYNSLEAKKNNLFASTSGRVKTEPN